MKTNSRGLLLIKFYEGLELTAYLCPAMQLTIGYGHSGPDVYQGMRITANEAEKLLQGDVEQLEKQMASALTVQLNSNQFSALISFAYNVGFNAFKKSTLLKVVNEGKDPTPEFKRWINIGGKPSHGLKLRREAEADLFNSPIVPLLA